MKILHLSTSDIEGGAARAAYRLHQGLQTIALDSQMLVRAKDSLDDRVIAKKDALTRLGPVINGIPAKLLYKKRDRKLFSAQWFPDSVVGNVGKIEPDIINLHWICNGFLKIENLAKLNKPLVWTLHDMWAFTGGCHTTQGCNLYKVNCGNCPQLKSSKSWDLSRWIWQRKAKSWQDLDLTIVSPSKWLGKCAEDSSLLGSFKTKVIPHGLNLRKYKSIEKKVARNILELPSDKQLIGFGSGSIKDKNKGFDLLYLALEQIISQKSIENIELVIFGSSKPQKLFDSNIKIHYLERFHDDVSLSLVYSSVDVMVIPSLQEAFGQTASESLACGTPVVAFDTTGLKDIVDHQQNGYLAQPYEVEDLAQGISWIFKDEVRYNQLCIKAREKAEKEFSLELQAQRYLSLYQEVIQSKV